MTERTSKSELCHIHNPLCHTSRSCMVHGANWCLKSLRITKLDVSCGTCQGLHGLTCGPMPTDCYVFLLHRVSRSRTSNLIFFERISGETWCKTRLRLDDQLDVILLCSFSFTKLCVLSPLDNIKIHELYIF